MTTAKWTKEAIKTNMQASDKWLFRGLLAIYSNQTHEEQVGGFTAEDNGIGFNGVDAEILTSFALQLNSRGFLTPRQIEMARKKMLKYAGQLAKIANGKV